jgi:hypothetical protein
MRHAKGLSFLAALAVIGAAPALADDAIKADASVAPINPTIQVSRGDAWTYDLRDNVTGDLTGTVAIEVTKASDVAIETRVTQHKRDTNADSVSVEVFDARWRLTDIGKTLFKPYNDATGVPTDLEVGKSWSFKDEADRKGSTLKIEASGVGTVEAWERVTLPSGVAYDAFKIDVSLSSIAANSRKHETHSVIWFAPSVNRFVKRVDETRVNGKLQNATEQTLREYKPAPRP